MEHKPTTVHAILMTVSEEPLKSYVCSSYLGFLFQYVLAVGSSVFCAMFYGDLAEEESEIHIPDVEPAAFLILLK